MQLAPGVFFKSCNDQWLLCTPETKWMWGWRRCKRLVFKENIPSKGQLRLCFLPKVSSRKRLTWPNRFRMNKMSCFCWIVCLQISNIQAYSYTYKLSFCFTDSNCWSLRHQTDTKSNTWHGISLPQVLGASSEVSNSAAYCQLWRGLCSQLVLSCFP